MLAATLCASSLFAAETHILPRNVPIQHLTRGVCETAIGKEISEIHLQALFESSVAASLPFADSAPFVTEDSWVEVLSYLDLKNLSTFARVSKGGRGLLTAFFKRRPMSFYEMRICLTRQQFPHHLLPLMIDLPAQIEALEKQKFLNVVPSGLAVLTEAGFDLLKTGKGDLLKFVPVHKYGPYIRAIVANVKQSGSSPEDKLMYLDGILKTVYVEYSRSQYLKDLSAIIELVKAGANAFIVLHVLCWILTKAEESNSLLELLQAIKETYPEADLAIQVQRHGSSLLSAARDAKSYDGKKIVIEAVEAL